MSIDREPLQDEAKARPKWRGDEEQKTEAPDEQDTQAALLKDLAERPPD